MFRALLTTALTLFLLGASANAGVWLNESVEKSTSLSAEAMVELLHQSQDDPAPSFSQSDGDINGWALLDASQTVSQTAVTQRGELEWGIHCVDLLVIPVALLPLSPVLDGLLKPA